MGAGKPSVAEAPNGVAANGAQQSNGVSSVKKALTKLRPSEATLKLLEKARWRVGLSFFVVGMSMATFIASALQCLDYLNAQYQELNVKKIIDTGYSFGFFVVAAQFFFKGKPDTSHKPRQRARLIIGILIQLLALILPIVVDTVFQELIMPKLPKLPSLEEAKELTGSDLAAYKKNKDRLWMLQSLMAIPWAIAAMLAGGSDGLLSVVIFAEAKAVKGDKAAQYGRVFVMVFMPALRCITKAIILKENALFRRLQLEDLSRLRISAVAHVGISALILLVCLVLVFYVVPKEVAVMQEVAPLNVPPALNMEATLQTAIEAEDDTPEGDEAKASMKAGGSLAAMNPAADASYVTPLIEIRGFSFKWLKPPVGANPDDPADPAADSHDLAGKHVDSIMAGVNRQPTMRRFVDTHRASMASRRRHSTESPQPAGASPLGTPRGSTATLSPLASTETTKDLENPSSAHTEAEVEAVRARARMRRLGSLSSTGSGSYRQRRSHSGDVQVIVGQAKEANNFILYDTESHPDQAAARNKEKQLSGVSEGDEKDEDGGKAGPELPPYPAQEPAVKEKPKDAGAEMSLGTKLKCCWEAALGVWPFMMICFIMPMVNSQLMQLAQQPKYEDRVYGRMWKATFYIQIVEFAKVLGGFGGSLFFHQVRRTWVMVSMAGVMLLFLPAFGLSYFCNGGPAVKIILAFVMCTYSGYLNSVAKGTSSKRRPAEERWIQMTLSLVSAAAFFFGNVIGWAWTAAPEEGAPWQDPDKWAQGKCSIWYAKPKKAF